MDPFSKAYGSENQSWEKNPEGILLAAELQGFEREQVQAAMNQMEGQKNTKKSEVAIIVAIVERTTDQARLCFWSSGAVEAYLVSDPFYTLADVGRHVIGDSYRGYFVYDSLPVTAVELKQLTEAHRRVSNSSTFVNALKMELSQFTLGSNSLFRLPSQVLSRLVVLTEEEAVARQEELQQAAVEEEERAESIKNGNQDYLEVSRGVKAAWGRGHNGNVRLKCGRWHNKQSGEYLVAPGLNFGDASWINGNATNWRNYRSGNNFTSPTAIVRHIASKWRTLMGTYPNEAFKKQFDNWLLAKPLLKIGFKDGQNRLLQRTLRLGLVLDDPKTKEPFTYPHYEMNGRRIPKNRLDTALDYWINPDVDDAEFNGFLDQMGKYTNEMLTLPGKTKRISIQIPMLGGSNENIDFDLRFNHRFHEPTWKVTCEDLMSVERHVDHEHVRKFISKCNYWHRSLSESLQILAMLGVTQEEVIQAMKVRAYKRMMSEQKGEELMAEIAGQFKDKITWDREKKEVIVKGKLRRYKIVIGDNKTGRPVAVYNADTNAYICIEDDAMKGAKVKWDAVASRALALMNDEQSQKFIHTIGR